MVEENEINQDNRRIPLHNRIPKTQLKLAMARGLYRLLSLVLRRRQHRIQRDGIHYEVDLSEGIDLSLFLFGQFQKHVLDVRHLAIPNGAVVFDIGANFGVMALQLAKLFDSQRVYAFEPTNYAFEKLKRNLRLNKDLGARITPVQTFLSDVPDLQPNLEAYSSWKVDKESKIAHRVHGGTIRSAEGIAATTIDVFCEDNEITRVDFIKIDTDGHELQVLKGGRQTVERFLPPIIFELGIYLMEENGVTFNDYDRYFSSLGYKLSNSKNGKPITNENYFRQIPLSATTDILATPP